MADRKKRYPRTDSPTEVRRAFQLTANDLEIVTDGLEAFITLVAATYIPYTGAISDVNLGAYDISATDGTFTGNVSIGYISSYTDVSADGEVMVWDASDSRFSIGDHGDIAGLEDDDHPQYTLTDGTRAFTGTVGGVTPVADSDLATKGYVDGAGGQVDMTNGEGVALVIGTPVYVSGDGTVSRAQATTLSKANVFGLVKDASIASAGSGKIIFSGVLEATAVQWDAVTGDTGGLSPQTIYYLSLTLGQLATVPVTEVGEVCTEIGTAISTTQLKIEIRRTVEL